nr:jhy protein-like [Ciona intestinalis]|eukprot:XP_018667279.1 jhy protein-like [Ciona intestinalis]
MFKPNPYKVQDQVNSDGSQNKFQNVRDSLSPELMTGYNQFELDDNDDDIHTVVVDDSLDVNQHDVELNEKIAQQQRENDTERENMEEVQFDPYAELRYNPAWRNTGEATIAGNQHPVSDHREIGVQKYSPIDFGNAIKPPNPIEASEHTRNETPQQQGGAITIHNNMLSPTRDSFVRLSSNPDRLVEVNTEYEEEFRRMLQLEARQRELESATTYQPSENTDYSSQYQVNNPQEDNQFQHHQNTYELDSNHYNHQAASQVSSAPARQKTSKENIQVNQKRNQTSNLQEKVTKRVTKDQPLVPNPPAHPKKNRDYVELNKLRLGRKSNSASYLEMYSKRNKQKYEENTEQDDVGSKDTDRVTQQRTPEISPHESNLTLEDSWTFKAERLKAAKEGRPIPTKPYKSPSLQEVGNFMQRPNFSPSDVAVHKGYQRISHDEDSQLDPNRINRRNPSKQSSYDGASDFSGHPAFSYNPQPNDAARYQHISPVRDKYQVHGSGSWQGHMGYSTDGMTSQYNYNQPGFNDSNSYYRVQQEGFNSSGQSPLLQAYHQRFNRLQPISPRYHDNKVLPPSHGIPMSPTKVNGDFQFMKSPPDSSLYQEDGSNSSEARSNGRMKKRVNFDPSIYSPSTPRSGIPISQHRFSKYPVPLPPTPPSHRHGMVRRSVSLSPSNGSRYIDNYTTDPQNEYHNVPVLPPIANTSNHSSVAVEQSPRLDPSDAASGSYLKQHEKQKKATSYKKYTLNDYKSLKRDINLGGLGPDLLSAKIKMDKVQRGKKYAEFIRQQHKTNVTPSKQDMESPQEQRFTMTNESEKKRNEMREKRERAINYARQVPRPKLPAEQKDFNDSNTPRSLPVGGKSTRPTLTHNEGRAYEDEVSAVDWELLRSLRERHEREKAMVAGISPNKVT